MTGEQKGENHNKVFYEVKQQVYFFCFERTSCLFLLVIDIFSLQNNLKNTNQEERSS